MDAARQAVRSPLSQRIKCCSRAGRTISTSNNFLPATNLENGQPTAHCSWWEGETTSSLQNLPAARSFNAYAVRADESSVMCIRGLDTIRSSTAPSGINWTGSQLVLQESRRQVTAL